VQRACCLVLHSSKGRLPWSNVQRDTFDAGRSPNRGVSGLRNCAQLLNIALALVAGCKRAMQASYLEGLAPRPPFPAVTY
jgi:hypothetical protein